MAIDVTSAVAKIEANRKQAEKASRSIWWVVVAVVAISILAILGWARVYYLSDWISADQVADQERDQHYQEVYDACNAADDCDTSGIPTPSEVQDIAPSVPPEAGEPVVVQQTLQPSEVQGVARDAMSWYCANHNGCVGPSGASAPPTDPAVIAGIVADYCGTGACDPTFETVLAAVQAVCADGACVGAQGPVGPGASDEQVQAQVAAYCAATGACVGAQGPAGRGIQTIACLPESGRWQVTYTDGAVEDAGPCIITAPPGPTESTEPGEVQP